ncbi:MAG: SsrA-binding protein SmpB [Gemmataceae bacterium]
MARDKKPDPTERDICRNRRALHDYEVLERLECGLVLTGTEVKSLRAGTASIDEAYAKVDAREVWLIGSDIPEYAMGNHMNHKPTRSRKVLLHRREIEKFAGRADERGFSLIPLRLYFKEGRAKIELGLCKGKQTHDKRESMKKADADREIKREMSRRRKG